MRFWILAIAAAQEDFDDCRSSAVLVVITDAIRDSDASLLSGVQ